MQVLCEHGWRPVSICLLSSILVISNDEGDAVYTPIRF